MNKELKKRIITSIVLITIILNCLFINNYSWLLLLSIISFICWFEFINLIKKIWKKNFLRILPIILSFLFLCLFIHTAYKLRIDEGAVVILFVLGICIFSDIGGYFFGKILKGKKLTKISPKKTYSGMIGAYILPLVFCLFFFRNLDLSFSLILLVIIVSIFLLLSLISYSPDDPNFIFPENTNINNFFVLFRTSKPC